MKKNITILVILVLLLGTLIGCSNTSQEVNQAYEQTNTEIENDVQSETVYPLTITDSSGTEVTIPSEPKRIVTLLPSFTESLYALGAVDKIIAVTIHDNYPENIQQQVEYVFEDGLNPNIEQIISLNPDLVLLGSFNEDLTTSLRNLNIPVVKFDPQNIAGVYEMLETLGEIVNYNEEAEELVTALKNKEQAIMEKTGQTQEKDKVRVWVEISNGLWTAGKGTFIDELIKKAGGINTVEEEGWLQYSEEKIIEQNPQIILITYGKYEANAVTNTLNREGWKNIEAIKNNRVLDINDDIVSRPGPRVIDGLEEIARTLYPNLFK